MVSKIGRPRSERAREAVLQAVDDLLVEVGYAALTMTAIAERAGVGRQTLYRWWSTKAEILLEASIEDAEDELSVPSGGSPLETISAYLTALVEFLTRSPAGASYLALIGAAQQDPAVAVLLAERDLLGDSATAVLTSVLPPDRGVRLDQAAARLVGPPFFWIMSGRDPSQLDPASLAKAFVDDLIATSLVNS